jgi:CBS domain containing-hemolysin-like protein
VILLAVGADASTRGTFSLAAVLVGGALLLTNALLVAAEIGLLASRRARLEERAEDGDRRARRALQLLRELSITLSGAQLGITLAALGLGAVAGPAVAALAADLLRDTAVPAAAVPAIAIVVALSLLVFLTMVVGETIPKHLALSRAEPVALASARPFGWFVALLRPLIVALNATANLLVRLVRVEPVDEHGLVHTPDELALAVAESRQLGTINPQDAHVMGAALRLATIDAEAAMTPRVDLVALPDSATPEQVLELAAATGHTRLPVYHEDIDHVVGLIHVKDVLIDEREDRSLSELLRPIPAVPGTRDLERLLRDMLDDRSHAVLVVDEFGGTAGLLTLGHVLEELVGEIDDEFDVEPQVRRSGERAWVVPGMLRRDELERLVGVRLVDGEAETVSGWMVERVERLLAVGDRLRTEDGWQLTVRSLEGRRAADVEVRRVEHRRRPAATT